MPDVFSIAPISDSQSTPQTKENYAMIIEKLIRFVCASNIPLRCLDSDFFRQAFYLLDINFDFPLRETMVKRIKDFATIIKNESFEKASNQKVSLLFDSAKNGQKITMQQFAAQMINFFYYRSKLLKIIKLKLLHL